VVVIIIVTLPNTSTVGSSASVLATIPPVLNSVVATAMKAACNFGPAFSNVLYKLLDQKALLRCDWLVVERWL
jgi:putative component of membrane protein insertase Oxa1/YidC/SpoIIIJ protein YidD